MLALRFEKDTLLPVRETHKTRGPKSALQKFKQLPDVKNCGLIIWVDTLPSKIHEEQITRKGFISMTHYKLVHKFNPMPQAMILDAKAAADKEWEKLKKKRAWQLDKVTSMKDVIREAQTEKESPLCYTDGVYSCRYTWVTSKKLEESNFGSNVEEIDGTCGF